MKSYRLITITSVTYRLAIQAVKLKLQAWMEGNKILGELRNGLRNGRCIDDGLFLLTQCIEIARAENGPLHLAFLNISGTYDNVNREFLWHMLINGGIVHHAIELMKEIYRDNTVEITWEGIGSGRKVEVHKRLRQGCPLLPLFFMIYMMNMERRPQESNLGYNLSYKLIGMVVEQRLLGLMYADDIALRAGSQEELQALVNIYVDEGKVLGFTFSAVKSEIMVFNDSSDQMLTIEGQGIPALAEYKYLGVWANEAQMYIEKHEYIRAKGRRDAAIMEHRTLWGYNRYEVVLGIWKGIMVPGLTLGMHFSA